MIAELLRRADKQEPASDAYVIWESDVVLLGRPLSDDDMPTASPILIPDEKGDCSGRRVGKESRLLLRAEVDEMREAGNRSFGLLEDDVANLVEVDKQGAGPQLCDFRTVPGVEAGIL